MYSALGSSIPLVNDLDLTVSNGTHNFYPYTPYTPTYQQIDRLNNVEVILIRNPLPNTTYTITVSAYQLSTEQSYALVMTGDLAATVLIKRASFPSNSSSLLTTFPLYVTIFILVAMLSAFFMSVYYLLKFRADYVAEKRYLTQNVVEPKCSTMRESNLRSFSERHDQFSDSNFPPTPHKKIDRKSQRSRDSRTSNGSILNAHELSEMYPSPPLRISQSVSPYATRQSPSHIGLQPRKSSKTCSKDLLLYYSQQQHLHLPLQNLPPQQTSPKRSRSTSQSNQRKKKSIPEINGISSSSSVSSIDAVNPAVHKV